MNSTLPATETTDPTEKRRTQVRTATAKNRQAKRKRGLVPKERWGHPDDWPTIDAFIAELTAAREA